MDYTSLGGGGSGGGSSGGPVSSSAESGVSFGNFGEGNTGIVLAGLGAAVALIIVALLIFQKN